MASNRKDIPFMFNALEGFGLFSMQAPVIPPGTPSEVAYPIILPFLSDLDQHYQEAEEKLLALLLEHGASSITIADNASIEDRNNLLQLIDQLMTEKVMPLFLQAIVDNDGEKVSAMLEKNPELLLREPDNRLVIESKLTWQKFYAEGALSMAVKRKQLKMIKRLLSHYDQFEQTEEVIKSKQNALSAWKSYDIQKNAENEDEIVIPEEYAVLAQSLIDAFKDETFPNGVPGKNGIPNNVELSEKTELALASLLNILVPKTAVTLDNHIDEELLLLAIYKAYNTNYEAFNDNWDKLSAICIRVMGLTQSALIPETGEIFCEGLHDVVRAIKNGKEKEMSDAAKAYKLKGGEAFYRASRDSRSGSGFDFLCGIFGAGGRAGRLSLFGLRGGFAEFLGKFMSSKSSELGRMMQPESSRRNSNWCFIL